MHPKNKVLIIDNNRKQGRIDSLVKAVTERVPERFVDTKRLGEIQLGAGDPFQDYHVIISSGSGMPWRRNRAYMELSDPAHKHLAEKAKSKYVLGICHGAQALAEAYGARIKNSGIHHRRSRKIESSHHLFRGAQGDYHANHRYYIPKGEHGNLEPVVVAESQHTKEKFLDVYQAGNRHYGIQLHPEKSDAGKAFIRNFLSKAYSGINPAHTRQQKTGYKTNN